MKYWIRRWFLAGGVFSASLGFWAPAMLAAQNTSSEHLDTGSAKMMRSPDLKFAAAAARINVAQIELGQIASEKGSNPEVKSFGALMATDYKPTAAKLQEIAARERITLPASFMARDQSLKVKVENLKGDRFDRAYIKAMVKDQKQDVKLFQKEAGKGSDPQIKGFASECLPVLQSHLEKAKAAQAAVTGKSAK